MLRLMRPSQVPRPAGAMERPPLAPRRTLARAQYVSLEKPSVGQRHVFLRREALPAIHALIDRGETTDPALATRWTAAAPARNGSA